MHPHIYSNGHICLGKVVPYHLKNKIKKVVPHVGLFSLADICLGFHVD